jgi:hypothetical protein
VPHPVRLEDYAQHEFLHFARHVRALVASGCPHGDNSLEADSRDRCKQIAIPDVLDGTLSDHPPGASMTLRRGAVASSVQAVLAYRPIGIAGCALGTRVSVVDSFGLADPLAARMELRERGRVGHEKSFSTVWFAAKYAAANATTDPQVAMARMALGCGALRELSAATHEPLGFLRFWRNVRQSVRLHKLRVPANPVEAVGRFCRGLAR